MGNLLVYDERSGSTLLPETQRGRSMQEIYGRVHGRTMEEQPHGEMEPQVEFGLNTACIRMQQTGHRSYDLMHTVPRLSPPERE